MADYDDLTTYLLDLDDDEPQLSSEDIESECDIEIPDSIFTSKNPFSKRTKITKAQIGRQN